MDFDAVLKILKSIDLGTITVGSIGGFVVGIFTLRKMYSESKKTDAEAGKVDAETSKIYADTLMAQFAAITTGYEHQIQMMRVTVDRVNEEVMLLRAENRKLGDSVSELSKTNAELRDDNENLRETNSELRTNIEDLRGEINRFLSGISSARNCSHFPDGCPAVRAIEFDDPMQRTLPGVE